MAVKYKIEGYTPEGAGQEVGLSASRVRQMCAAGAIDYTFFGTALVITEKGLRQLRNRKTAPGPSSSGRKK